MRCMKTMFGKTKEQQSTLPRMNALCEIVGIERTQTKETSKIPGCRMYVVEFGVVEPAEYTGSRLREWIVVGTAEDKKALDPKTWQQGGDSGPGKLLRLLNRSGTPVDDDDEVWMAEAEGNQVVVGITRRIDDNGEPRNGVAKGGYWRQDDDDCPPIGIVEEDEGSGKGAKAKKGKSPAQAAQAARAKAARPAEVEEDEDEDEKPKKKARAKDEEEDDEEDEEEPPKKKGKKAVVDEDDEDDDEDAPPPPKKKAATKGKVTRKVVDDEDDDED